jgi:hypothetical protein
MEEKFGNIFRLLAFAIFGWVIFFTFEYPIAYVLTVLPLLILALKNPYVSAIMMYAKVGGYWTYRVQSFANGETSEGDQYGRVRLAKISFNWKTMRLYVEGWLEGSPRNKIFHSKKTYAELDGLSLYLSYEYTTPNPEEAGVEYSGNVVLKRRMVESQIPAKKISGQYVSNVSQEEDQRPDSGQIEYKRVTKEKFLELLNGLPNADS